MANAPDPVPDPDALFRRWRGSGDPAHLGALFDRVAPDLFRVAVSLCGDGASAEDAVQETFLAVMGSADAFDPSKPLMPWLLSILRHKLADARRRDRRVPDPLRLDPRLLEGDPATEAERRELVLRVREALDRLPDPYRAVALLRWEYGLEPGDIARVLGEPPGTVRSLLFRARERLERALRGVPLLALLGTRAPRGLDAVRGAVVREAARAAAAGAAGGTAGGTAASLLGGVLLAKNTVAVAAAALLVLGGAAWWLARTPPREEGPAVATAPPPPPAAPVVVPPAPAAPGPGAAAAPAGARLALRVMDGAGRPVAGASASVEPRLPKDESNPWRQELLARPSAPAASASTGPDGAAALEGLAAGEWRLRVTAPDFAVDLSDLRVPGPGEEVARTVVLLPAWTLEGTVTGEGGAPVPGAEVTADACRARTDAAGRFRLDGLPPGTHEVSVRSGGALYRDLAFVAVPGPRRLDLRLEGGAALEGRVLDDATGAPVPGARVFLLSSLVSGMPRLVGFSREAAADGEGRFRIDGVPPSHAAALEVRAEGFLLFSGWNAAAFPPHYRFARGDLLRLDVRLRRGAPVRGRVSLADGSPVAGAAVELLRARGPGEADAATSASTGPDGRYSLLAPPGPGLLRVRAAGLVQPGLPGDPWGALRGGTIPAACLVEVAPAGGTVRDVVLEPAKAVPPGSAVLAGRVRRGDGLPLPAAWVRVYSPPRDERVVPVLPDGSFRAEGLPAGTHSLEARAEGLPAAWASAEGLADGEERSGIELVLPPGWDLEGRVLDEAGAPVAGAEARAVPLSKRWSDRAVAALSDADGRFAVRGLPREDAILEVGAPGFSDASRIVSPDDTPTVALGRSRSIAGTALEEGTGRPVPGLLVWANEGTPREGAIRIREALTDAGGRFRIDGLEDLEYDVCTGRVAEAGPAGEFAPAKAARVKGGASDVRLVLRRGLPIAGRVLDGEGRPAPGGTVDGNGPEGGAPVFQRAAIGPDGSFRIRGLPPGTYVLSASPGGGLAPVRAAGVAAGTEDLVLRASASLTIRGRLLLEDGTPFPPGTGGFDLRWRNPDGTSAATGMGMWNADGSFETIPLDPEKAYDIVLYGRPGWVGGAARGVRPGTKDLVVTVAKGGALEGRVLDEEGRPPPAGTHVMGMGKGIGSGWPPDPGQSVNGRTAADGSFRLEGLADVPYSVYALGGDFLPAGQVLCRAGAPDVVLRVRRGAVLAGRVVDADGKPLGAGFVRIDRHGSPVPVDREGRFRAVGDGPGERRVYVQVGDRTLDLGPVTLPAEDVVLALPRE